YLKSCLTTRPPPSPTSSASSSSFSSGPPQTPSSPSFGHRSVVIPSLPDYVSADYTEKSGQTIAQRRASHNAVERARRETLNARFLDLAALLPNLKHLRRPSKSSIVNSSIAHVRAARRYRLLAAQQLRALNAECDSVRREVNQWRARAGVQPLITPTQRSEGFLLMRPPARRPAPEPASEPPLLLSHPYATSTPAHSNSYTNNDSTSPPYYDSASPPYSDDAALPSYNASSPLSNHSATPTPPSSVAVPFETPNPYAGFLLQPQQGDMWAYGTEW
ncbi:hypothetical protein C8J57DRAFT_1341274, partial [Mycena rebaudengoi]